MSELNVELFINRLVETGHHLVFAQEYQEAGTYIIAENALALRREEIPGFLKSAFQVQNDEEMQPKRPNQRDSMIAQPAKSLDTKENTAAPPPSASPENSKVDLAEFEETQQKVDETRVNKSSLEDGNVPLANSSAYLIVFCARTPFLWHGSVLLGLDIPEINLGMVEQKLLLISEGGQAKLSAAKARFAAHFSYDEDSTSPQLGNVEADGKAAALGPNSLLGTLPVLVEQRSHLPAINKELARVTRATNRLAFKIVESYHPVRKALRGIPGFQELLQNWFLFAAEHAHQHSPSLEFTRALTTLAISWVSFICDDCDSTDRRTFKWAVTALEFAKNRVGTSVILQLPADQFVQLRRKVAMCMSLLIRHFDILGARSSNEAKQARERQEEQRRQLALEARLQSEDTDYLRDLMLRDEDASLQSSGFIATVGPASIRSHREDLAKQLEELERSRDVPEGRVLDDNVPEDRTLFLLASSHANVSIRWQQGKLIGRGAFGSVYLASNMDTGTLMAVKEIHFQDVAGLLPSLYKSIKDELSVMEMLRHPNIVEYYGIEVHRDRVYIFEEYCQGGSLANLLDLGRIEDEMVIQMYALQMLDGLVYLHSRNVVHRDIKPDSTLSVTLD
jgi:mitogen-activated protein kinase kinase kinase